MQQKNFPIGISDFKKIIQTQSTFVDKTLFIKDIVDNHAGVILITRPRRFGKTLNMSMLQRFLEKDGDSSLFDGLKISKEVEFCARHQNKYPVIFLSFKDVKFDSFEKAFSKMKMIFQEIYNEYVYLLEGNTLLENEKKYFSNVQNLTIHDPVVLSAALFNLIHFVKKKHGISPILLLDEYDSPIHGAYTAGYYPQMIDFMRALLGTALKDNSHLGKAVMTGILRVSQESLFSGLNNIRVYSVLDEKYSSCFGFIEEEVHSLLPEYMDISTIRDWYNGYKIGDNQVYNPWSIISYLENKCLRKPYWINTSDNALVFTLVENAKPAVQDRLKGLIAGETQDQVINDNITFKYLENDEDSIWSLLIHAGYLNITSSYLDENGQIRGRISIPNKEVMSIYVQIVQKWFILPTQSTNYYETLLASLEKGNVPEFVMHVREYIQTSGSYFDFSKTTPERVFHSFMLGLLVGLRDRYTIQSNREAGFGRADMIFIPKDPSKKSIVLEFKVCKNTSELQSQANSALMQIKEKQYTTTLKNTLLIGMAFCGKEMVSSHEIIGE